MAKSESGECSYADEKYWKVKEEKDCSKKLTGYICEFFYPKKSAAGKYFIYRST